VADGIPLPSWKVRVIDYFALGFILLAPEELWRHPSVWYSWSGALVAGGICAWFGDTAPTIRLKLVRWWRAPKDLATALIENASLKQENSELRRSLDASVSPVAILGVRQSLPASTSPNSLVKPKHNVQCIGFKVISDDPFAIAALCFQNVPIPGGLIGKFEWPRLRVVYYENSTGQEIADLCPLQWWGSDDRPIEINANGSHAVIASYFEGEWKAYEVNEPSDDFGAWNKLHSVDLLAGEFRIIATLSGVYNLGIAPLKGLLTLGKDGTASFHMSRLEVL